MSVNLLGNFLKLPKLPVAGLWLRILAHLIDWILILSALHLFARAIPSLYFALGRWAPYANSLFTFLYFVLFNGPFGRGRTLGKLIMGIRVTDYLGGVISYRQSLIRMIILYPLFVTIPIAQAIVGTPHGELPEYFVVLFTQLSAWAVWLATVIVIAFNPYKQGMHDFVAETLVQPGRGVATTRGFEDLGLMLGNDWRQFHRQPQMSGLITVAMVLALLGYMSHPSRRGDKLRETYRQFAAISEEPEFSNARLEWFRPVRAQEYTANTAFYDLPKLQPDDAISSESLVYVLKADSPISWDKQLTKDQQHAAALKLTDRFMTILPSMLQQLRETRLVMAKNSNQSSEVESIDELLEKARKHPVVILSLLNRTITLTPYPDPLQKNEYVLQTVKSISIE